VSGPRAAAVIVQYGGAEACRACIESLERSEGIEAIPVLVDQNRDPDSHLARLARAAGGLALSHPENPGFAAGANRGIEAALRSLSPRTLLVLNADVHLAPDCVRRLDEVVHADPRIGIAGPGLLSATDPAVWWNAGSEISWPSGRPKSLLHGEPRAGAAAPEPIRDTDFVCGSALALRSDAWRRLGPLPEEYFLYFEDAHYSYHARRVGLRTVVVLDAIAWHVGGASLSGLESLAGYYRARNRLLFSRAWNPHPLRGRVHRGLFALRTVARSWARFAATGRRDDLLPALAVLDHARGRRGKPGRSGDGRFCEERDLAGR
jgi:GT2 family glycosyltransferase